jgi:hypothetical protein
MTVLSTLSRIESLQAEFDRQARELLASLEAERVASLERERQMREVTRRAIAECERVLGKLEERV